MIMHVYPRALLILHYLGCDVVFVVSFMQLVSLYPYVFVHPSVLRVCGLSCSAPNSLVSVTEWCSARKMFTRRSVGRRKWIESFRVYSRG